MRAFIQWLALAPVLVIAGCSTFHRPPSADSGLSLSGDEANLAEALAHFSQALISENTLGEYQTGLSHFRQAAALDPSNLALSLRVGADAVGRKDYTGAVSILERTVDFHPRSVEGWLLLGISRQSLGQPDVAARAFQKAITLDPRRADGYVRLATLYVVRLQPRRALSVTDEALKRLSDPAPILEFCGAVGRIYLAGKDASGAARFLEKAFCKGKGKNEDGELLADCYSVLGQYDDSVSVYEILLKQHPDNSHWLLQMGEAHERNHAIDSARRAYAAAIKAGAMDSMPYLRLANIEMEVVPRQAVTTLDAGLVKFPDDVKLHVFLSLALMRSERFEEAVKQFEWIDQAMARDETLSKSIQPLFYFWYGQACERSGHYGDAERLMQKYLVAYPDSGEVLNYMAYMWAEQGRNLDQALEYVTRALKAHPKNGAYLDTLGWIYYKKTDYAKALENLSLALNYEGADSAIFDHLGDVWAKLGNPDKAIKMWRKSLKMTPTQTSVRAKLVEAGVPSNKLP